MATKRGDRLAVVIKDIEAMAKQLRADVRRAARDAGLSKSLEKAAAALRKQAAMAAGLVEKYAHELRMDLSRVPVRARVKRRTA